MAKTKKIDIKQVIADALEHYHKMKPSIKESTKRQNESLLSEFYRFVDTLPARDKTMKIFSQKGLNRYKEYLIDKMNVTKTDGKKRNFGVGQLNRCGSMIARLINSVLCSEEVVPNRVVWIKVEDPRRKGQKGHFPLLDDEVTAIEICSGLTPVEEEYRDIFLLQIECGQRVSDLASILTGEYEVGQVDGYECIILSTKKEDIQAAVVLSPKVRMLLERIKTHKLVDPKEFKEKTDGKGNNTYNEAIRRIAKKAGLDRIIVKIDTNKIVEKKPLYEVITNHDARHTFITNKIRAGMTPEEVIVFTGHANAEMIRRVYAQPTMEDKIRNVKRFLSSDKKEKRMQDDSSVSGASPTVAKEVQVDEVKSAEMPKRIPDNDSNQFNDFKNYLDGLKEIVDIGLAEADKADALEECIDGHFESISLEDVDKDETLRVTDDPVMMQEWLSDPNTPYAFFSMLTKAAKKVFKESNKIDEEGRTLLRDISEELEDVPAVRFVKNSSLIWKIDIFSRLFKNVILHGINNRPIVDNALINKLIKRKLNYSPKWTIVHHELQKIPDKKLEALVENSECPRDIKTKLYNSIVSDDFDSFSNTIDSCEHEAKILIIYAYELDFYNNKFLDIIDKISSTYPNGILACSNEDLDLIHDSFILQSPFRSNASRTVGEDYLVYQKEQLVSIWFMMVDAFEMIRRGAYSSEKRIFDRVIKRMGQYTEFKEVYEEYNHNEKSEASHTGEKVVEIDIKNVDNIKNNKGEGTRRNRRKDDIVPNYITINSDNLDVDELIRLLTEKDILNNNQQFITVLESTNNVDVATCLRHFLVTPSTTPLSFRFQWNGYTMLSLKFLIRLLTNTNKKASRSDVIDKSKYDGISKEHFSKRTRSNLWRSVCSVFGGSPDYMMSVGLGEEGTEVREKNIEQIETIADIYFACKK